MNLTAKSNIRMRKGRKLFRVIHEGDSSQIKATDIKFLYMISEEEALFEFPSRKNKLWVVFHKDDITTYSDEEDMFEDCEWTPPKEEE